MHASPSRFAKLRESSELDGTGLILMDDSGSAIDTDEGKQDRKSWVAVLIPPSDSSDAITQMDGLSDELQRQFGVREFHAHEVFHGRGSWSHVSIPHLKAVVATVARILGPTRFPIVVQTFWKGNESHGKLLSMIMGQHLKLMKRKFRIDFRSPKDAALVFCLFRCLNYIKDCYPHTRWHVFADAGKRQPGQTTLVPLKWSNSEVVRVNFEDSKLCPLIQLADFAAYFMNRSQQIANARSRTRHEEELLDILGQHMNFVNIEYQTVSRQHVV